MPGFISEKKRLTESKMCFSISVQQDAPNRSKGSLRVQSLISDDHYVPILPGLPDDVAKLCLALVPRSDLPAMGAVSNRWRSFIRSKEFITIRKQHGLLEEWLYMLTVDDEGKESHWEVLDCFGNKHDDLPSMPGGLKVGSGVVVFNGKLLVMGGCTVSEGTASATADVYQYESCLNRYVTCLRLFFVVFCCIFFASSGKFTSSCIKYAIVTD